jgi:hypothetical protein
VATAYYTDEMMEAFRECPNNLNFPFELTQLDDQAGPYLCIKFNRTDYEAYMDNEEMLNVIVQDLVFVRNTLISKGARVTFAMVDDDET